MEFAEHMKLSLYLEILFSVIGVSVFPNWHSSKLGFYLPQNLGDETLSSLM